MRKKNVRCLVGVMSCLALVAVWAVLAVSGTALAKHKPNHKPGDDGGGTTELGKAGFFSSDVNGVHNTVAGELVNDVDDLAHGLLVDSRVESNYRTFFGTGNVEVTSDGSESAVTVLDSRPFLGSFTDDDDIRQLHFAIGVKGGHHQKDHYSNLDGTIPFPTYVWGFGYEENPEPAPGVPSLEVIEGDVDGNLDMLPGARVILHVNVSGVLLQNTRPNIDHDICCISIGDIEFTFPE